MKEIDLIKGPTLPASFLKLVESGPSDPMFFSKKEGVWRALHRAQGLEFVRRAAAGFKKLGIKPGSACALYIENREEWLLLDYAHQSLRGVTTAIYMTSTAEQIEYILNHSEASTLIISKQSDFKKLAEIKSLPHLKCVIYLDEGISPLSKIAGLEVVTRGDFLKEILSIEEFRSLSEQVQADDLAAILYTSGTTGEPKGVMLSQQNLVADIFSMQSALRFKERMRSLSFLPLCHIYERCCMQWQLFSCFEIYFAESIDKVVDNLSEVKPHVMTSVPRIFEKIYAKVQAQVKTSPPLKQKIFKGAEWVGRQTFSSRCKDEPLTAPWKFIYPVVDQLVFKKIRAILGGEAKYFISGGAPLSQEIAEFFFSAGFTILEGYGMSETCILSCNVPGNVKFGTVGQPFVNVQFKLASDGEILVKAPSVMNGYFKKPEETESLFTSDGFFKTGDIGVIDPDGFLKITDRKKEIIITAGGKNIAPQPVENALKENALIESACLIGDKRKYITVLLVPNLEIAKNWGKAHQQKIECLDDCVSSDHFQKEVQKCLDALNQKLPSYSSIKYFRLLNKPFAMETGELTPTLKLKRRIIESKYKSEIDSMYDDEV